MKGSKSVDSFHRRKQEVFRRASHGVYRVLRSGPFRLSNKELENIGGCNQLLFGQGS